MKIQLKDPTVNLDGLAAPMLLALMAACREYQAQGLESVVITSARDGKHMNASLHYCGNAVDLRIWGLRSPERARANLSRRLGKKYDVILKPTHLHIEFDPR